MSQGGVRDQLIELLGDGHSQVAVAQALGISESRVSQLLQDPELRAQVAAVRAKKLGRESRIEEKRVTLEEKILEKLERAIPIMALSKPLDIARVYQIISASRKASGVTRDLEGAGAHVTVVLPAGILGSKFKLNAQNEVIEVEDGVPLITANQRILGEANDQRAKDRVKLQAGSQRLAQITADQI